MTSNKSSSIFIPVFLLMISMLSVQGSASLAKHLFPLIGPLGMAAMRLFFSSIMLTLIFKPWRKRVSAQAWKPIIIYGLTLGIMNVSFYKAISLIPLGIAVALEFSGPLAVAMIASRRLVDFVWIILAIIGLALLLPFQEASDSINPFGVIFALVAGVCWAMYIIFGRKAGVLHGPSSVAIGSLIATLFIFPLGVVQAGSQMFTLTLLPMTLLVAVLASALPYGLEMIALPRLPAQTFSILMSLAPALAALSGFIFLKEQLNLEQWIALCCIITASIGATLTIKRNQ